MQVAMVVTGAGNSRMASGRMMSDDGILTLYQEMTSSLKQA
jgi:hypothetical protein